MSSSWVGKTAIGCGAGCLVIVVAIVVVAVVFVQDTTSGFEQSVDTREQIDERFGAVDAWLPPPAPAPSERQLERFLAVRQASQAAREGIADVLDRLVDPERLRELEQSEDGWGIFREVMGMTGASFKLGGRLGDFFAARNAAMLEQEMGMGEYAWLYSLCYVTWLEHPFAGSVLDDQGDGTIKVDVGGEIGGQSLDRVRDALRAMTERQLATLPESADPAWREALSAEVALLQADDERVPWQDGLFEATAAGLEPYRARLEATFRASTHGFELSRNKKRGSMSYTTDF